MIFFVFSLWILKIILISFFMFSHLPAFLFTEKRKTSVSPFALQFYVVYTCISLTFTSVEIVQHYTILELILKSSLKLYPHSSSKHLPTPCCFILLWLRKLTHAWALTHIATWFLTYPLKTVSSHRELACQKVPIPVFLRTIFPVASLKVPKTWRKFK